ncbi:class D beta-lactamase [Alteromonas sp. 5E99-2]|uniref:class D beta-lactamase n=1 Tax=Alteromonas sp. 5E99-2 TaxID=2817683 RepID=UPI001A981FE0|nr:class D beta-lactamase [Alteromonas sp. 5E99-2]
MKLLIYLFCLLIITPLSYAEDAQIQALFERNNASGTMVISSLNSHTVYIHNAERANTPFSTASTFKIPNSLIALEENLIKDSKSVIKWDGTEYEYTSWNKDQTLQSAYKVSCVWCYQKLANEIGPAKYKSYLSKMRYGQLTESFNTTTFWLDNSLTITATQQIDFLKHVYNRSLPFSPSSYDTLSEIMIEDINDTAILRAKTGWAARLTPQVGWYVGYVEKGVDVWFFATNLEIKNKSDLTLRKQLTLEALRIKGILKSH